VRRESRRYSTVSDAGVHHTVEPIPRIYIPEEHGGLVILPPPPQTLGFLFVASCDSQGYSGGIRSRLHRQVPVSQSYSTTDGQSASLSWNKTAIWGLRPDSHYIQKITGLLMWGALFDEKSVIYNCCWSSSAQSFSGPSLVGLVAIFYCLTFDTSLFVASYDSRGHGGSIRPRTQVSAAGLYSLGSDRIENTTSKICYSLPRRGVPLLCLATTASSFTTIPLPSIISQYRALISSTLCLSVPTLRLAPLSVNF
jgi:hypothetical protein